MTWHGRWVRTIQHFTSQLAAVNQAIAEIIDNDPDLCAKRDLLVSISGVGETLAGIVLAELPEPDVLGSSAAAAAYAGLNPQQYRSGTSINRPARISKIGNAVLRTALYMPALSAMRYNPVVAALVNRLKEQGRLKGKQIVIAAMRKLLVLCFGVLNSTLADLGSVGEGIFHALPDMARNFDTVSARP